jgi:phage terminase large subunit GpA-like protein
MVKPATYPEDWDLLKTEVMDKVYPLAGKVGEMKISMSFCDSGGRAGATTNAYAFWRKLRETGEHARFRLVKGTGLKEKPRVEVVYPDTQRKDRKANARGEIPLLMFNVNALKDTLNGMLNRTEPGGGMVQISNHFEFWFFEELCREVRDDGTGTWLNPGNNRNEAWDLLVYFLGACRYREVEKVNWDDPPSWLKPWEENPLVRLFQAQKGKVDKSRASAQTFAALAGELA